MAADDGHHAQILADQAQQLRSRDKIISEMRSRQQGLTGAHAGVPPRPAAHSDALPTSRASTALLAAAKAAT